MTEQDTTTESEPTRWHTNDSSGPDEAAVPIGIYDEEGLLVADVIPAERQRAEPPEYRPGSFSLRRGGEEKVELMAKAPELRDALEELYGQLEPILAHERNVSFEAMEQAKDALLAAGVDVDA